MITLTPRQVVTIVSALTVAAKQHELDAIKMNELQAPTLAHIFDKRSADALKLAEIIQAAVAVKVQPA